MSNEKICPIMSRPIVIQDDPSVPADVDLHDVVCLEHKCRLYIEVYTTEGYRYHDCAYALMPVMSNGQMRV